MLGVEKGVIEELAGHLVATSFDDVPQNVRTRIAEHVLDAVGVGLAGSGEPAGEIIKGLFSQSLGNGGSTIFASGLHVEPWDAAWANGSFCHLLDFDDIEHHPTACILPAVLAVGERADASGADVIAAMAIGYEVFFRVMNSFEDYQAHLRIDGVHPMCIAGAPAAAAAASHILGLDSAQTTTAIGIASSQGFGLLEQFGTWAKGLQAGNAARAGVTGAMLAQKNYFGSKTAVEGKYGLLQAAVGGEHCDPKVFVAPWGESWYIEKPGVPLKFYPVCGGAQRATSASLHLRHNMLPADAQIERVVVSATHGLLQTLHIDWPHRGFEGKFCLRGVIALGLVDGNVDIELFSDENFARPEMQDMMKRIEVVTVEGGYGDPDLRRHTPIKVFCKDGSVFEKFVSSPRGSLPNPMTRTEVIDKYIACAGRVLDRKQVDQSLRLLEDIQSTTVRELVGSLTPIGA